MQKLLILTILAFVLIGTGVFSEEDRISAPHKGGYASYVQKCADILIESATDRYGKKHTPIFVSILDVETRECPEQPLALDEEYRVNRRERRNPAGANLLTDQPLVELLFRLSESTGKPRYADAAEAYIRYYLTELVDEKGFFWWGWHRHYDVYRDRFDGHGGNHHEMHDIFPVAWERLWEVNPVAVQRQIESVWEWHVIDKTTGEINRHGDKQRGCDFAMSGGSHLRAFAFLYSKTQDVIWLNRARLIASYYHDRRNPETDLFPDRPNAGTGRFDGSAFMTSITGLYCRSLLDAFELTGKPIFKENAVAYLRAYAKYGYDETTGKFWGSLNLDGTPRLGPHVIGGYAQYEPRGHLDLWQPYVAGYEFPLDTAQVYLQAYDMTKAPEFLETARRFAEWIVSTPPGSQESENTWYAEYSAGVGKQGTYAGKYGRVISFFLRLHKVTGENVYLEQATTFADEAIEKLYHNGLFRGHPAKPYYEAMDGVGFLLQALLELDKYGS